MPHNIARVLSWLEIHSKGYTCMLMTNCAAQRPFAQVYKKLIVAQPIRPFMQHRGDKSHHLSTLTFCYFLVSFLDRISGCLVDIFLQQHGTNMTPFQRERY
jgi:hypothetical protein